MEIYWEFHLNRGPSTDNRPFCVPDRGAAVSVEGPASGSVLPAQVWLPDLPVDSCRNQQAGAGPEGRRGRPGGHRAGRVRAEGVQGWRVFQRK